MMFVFLEIGSQLTTKNKRRDFINGFIKKHLPPAKLRVVMCQLVRHVSTNWSKSLFSYSLFCPRETFHLIFSD